MIISKQWYRVGGKSLLGKMRSLGSFIPHSVPLRVGTMNKNLELFYQKYL